MMKQISLFDDIANARDSIFAWDQKSGDRRILDLPSNQMVFHEGNRSEYVYEVLSGTLKLLKATEDGRQLVLGFPTVGEIIGLGGLNEYLHSAETVSSTKLLPILRKSVEKKFAENAQTAGRFFDWIEKQLTSNIEHVSLLANTHIQSRVAAFLLNSFLKQSQGNADFRTLYLPMTQRDIASYLAIAPETYSRVLRKFREGGILGLQNTACGRGGIKISSLSKLEQIALGENI